MGRNIARLLDDPIDTPEQLAEFLANSDGLYRAAGERLILSKALSVRSELWQALPVQSAVRIGGQMHENVRIIFGLLGCEHVSPDKQQELLSLLSRKNMHLVHSDIIFRLLTSLHQRGVLDAPPIILPKMRWYSGSVLWEMGIMTLRVCAPRILRERKTHWIGSLKSLPCRIMLRIFAAFESNQLPEGRREFQRTVAQLAQLPNKTHSRLLCNLAWVSMYEGRGLACAILKEMVALHDYRDCEVLIPFLTEGGKVVDREILEALASGPNRDAAQWARRFLHCA
jgi:ribosomal protein S18